MNFSEWLKKTRKTRLEIHRMGLKVITAINAFSLLFWISAIDSVVGWTPWVIMGFNIAWLVLIAYANGMVMDTKPYQDRVKKEGELLSGNF